MSSAAMQPIQVNEVDLVFPGEVSKLMVPYNDIPEDFRRRRGEAAKWVDLQQRWFFSGLPKGTKFVPREGVDEKAALRHLRCIQGSFEPKHEHKEACVAYLMSLWFSDVEIAEAK